MSTVILQQLGSDYVVNIPRDLIQHLNLKPGAVLEIRAEQRRLMIEPAGDDLAEVKQIHQELMDQYEPAFRKLAE